jgi:starch-binding outer membrane protein, SusD/RagB family
MKKYSSIILFLTLILSGCASLEEDPQSFVTSDQFYETEDDAIAAVTSVYNSLSHNTDGDHASIYNRLLVLAVGMSSDDHQPGPRATNADVRSVAALTSTSTNNRYSELWRQLYQGINRANTAIDRIPQMDMDTTLQSRLVREAKFLRALYYFNLVRLWGAVPLVLHETTSLNNLNVSRDSIEDVYAQIISDLGDAENLPSSYSGANIFRATSGAAKAILLDVYATRQNWDGVISKYEELSRSPYSYSLFPKYADIFNTSKENSVEQIFSVQCAGDGQGAMNGTTNANILGIIAAPVKIGGADADAPNDSLYQIFGENDLRRRATFYSSYTKSGTTYTFTPHFRKYLDTTVTTLLLSSINIPVIRYAEVLLFLSEAENEKHNGPTTAAYTAINIVRNRAGLPNLTTGLTVDQFRDSVYLERRKEFVYEQIRWFDLLRTKRLVSALINLPDKSLDADNIKKYYLLPIPGSEIDVNPNLTQNPGWE